MTEVGCEQLNLDLVETPGVNGESPACVVGSACGADDLGIHAGRDPARGISVFEGKGEVEDISAHPEAFAEDRGATEDP